MPFRIRVLISFFLLLTPLMGETHAADILPSTTGYNLGSDAQRWDAFIQNLDVSNQIKFPFLGYTQCLEVNSNGIVHGTHQACGTGTGGGGLGGSQIQSNWSQTDNTQVDYIRNKPTIPAQLILQSGGVALSPTGNVDRIEAGAGIQTGVAGNILTISTTGGLTTLINPPTLSAGQAYTVIFPTTVSTYNSGVATTYGQATCAATGSCKIQRLYGSALGDWDVWGQFGGFSLPGYVNSANVVGVYGVVVAMDNGGGGNPVAGFCSGTLTYAAAIKCNGTISQTSIGAGQTTITLATGGAASSFNYAAWGAAVDNVSSCCGSAMTGVLYANQVALLVVYTGTQTYAQSNIQVMPPLNYNVAANTLGLTNPIPQLFGGTGNSSGLAAGINSNGTSGQVWGMASGSTQGWISGAGGTPSGSAGGDLSGTYPNPTVAKVNGTSVPTNAAADQTIVTTSAGTGAWKSVPDCQDTGGNHLNYNTTTHAWSCGLTGGTAGSAAFNTITSGTNTTAAMLVGTGASLGPTGSGTVNANQINGTTPAASATTDTTSATNITSGTLPNARLSAVPLTALATQAADTVVQNVTGSSASPTAVAIPNCQDSSGNHLNYNTTTHAWSCGTSAGAGAGGSAVAVSFSGTAGSTLTLTHSLGTNNYVVACYDGSGNKTDPKTFAQTSTNAAQASFLVSSGTCIFSAGSAGTTTAGTGPLKEWKQLPVALCNGPTATAATGFSLFASTVPTPTCATPNSTVQMATLDFSAGVQQAAQYHFPLPLDVDCTKAFNVYLTWRATATTGNVTWGAQLRFVGSGTVADGAFNTAGTVTTNAAGTTLQQSFSSITSLTSTGCSSPGGAAPGQELYLNIYRGSGDTMSGAAQLISATIQYQRAL